MFVTTLFDFSDNDTAVIVIHFFCTLCVGTPKQNRTAHTVNQLHVPYELGVL